MSFVPCVPTPNHKKLLNGCYPKKKVLLQSAPNYAPDSNSLGKLVYYCQMKPYKLTKVGRAMVARSQRDVRSANPKGKAEMCVTLAILKKLIVDCRENLSFFATQALEVMEAGLSIREVTPQGGEDHRDLEIGERVAGAFHAFATFAEGSSIGIDLAVTRKYLGVLAQFCAMAKEPYERGSSSATATRVIGLHGIDGAVTSDVMYAGQFEEQAAHIIPALLQVLYPKDLSVDALRQQAKKLESDGKAHEHHSIKRPLPDRRPRSVHAINRADEKDVTREDVALDALRTLRTIFRLSHSSQLSSALDSMTLWLDRNGGGSGWKSTEWLCWLGETLTRWTHLQYRFVILNSLIDRLTDLGDSPSNSEASSKQTTLLSMISSILTGKISLVGLGIGDILGQLLHLLVRRCRVSSKDSLIPALTTCIGNLAHHIYYADQVNDLVQDVVSNALSIKSGSLEGAIQLAARDEALRAHAECLLRIMQAANASNAEVQVSVPMVNGDDSAAAGRPMINVESSGRRSFIRPEVWQESLPLLQETNPNVRYVYGHALLWYVGIELPRSEQQSSWTIYHALYANAYSLTLSRALGDGSRPVSRSPSQKPNKANGTRTSLSSGNVLDQVANQESSMATPADYAVVRDVLVKVNRADDSQASAALLASVPMLLSLDRNAGIQWGSLSEGASTSEAERRQASREIVIGALEAIGEKWGVSSVTLAAKSARDKLSPSVLPQLEPFEPAGSACSAKFAGKSQDYSVTSGPIIDPLAIIDALAGNLRLQEASGMSNGQLRMSLSIDWSIEWAMQRSTANVGGISQMNGAPVSVTRVVSSSSRASLRSPSVADLKASLTQAGTPTTGHSYPNSISSNAPTPVDSSVDFSASTQRRRSSKASRHEQLASVGIVGSQGLVAESPSKGGKRLSSLLQPPYAGVDTQ